MRNYLVIVFAGAFGLILSVLFKLEGIGYWVCIVVSIYVCEYLFSPSLAKQKIKTDYRFIRHPIAYKVDLSIRVNPKALFGRNFENDLDGLKLIEKIINDPELGVDKENSFLGNCYSFTLIRDEVSGLSLIYDSKNKEFIDEIEIYGSYLECNAEKLKQKYHIENSLVNANLVMENCILGYRDNIAPFGGMDKPITNSDIPTDMIIEALTRLRFSWGNPMHAVKKFNKELQDCLDKENIKYDTSNVNDFGIGIEFQGREMKNEYVGKIKKETGLELYDDKLYSHIFESRYLIASITMKFMDKIEFI